MTTTSIAQHAARGAHATAVRHPVRVDTDGDFALDGLLTLPGASPAQRIKAADATCAALWRPDAADLTGITVTTRPHDLAEHDAPAEVDAVLLHKIETAGLFRPPVHEHVAALTPAVAAAWLALAAHWIDLSESSGDLRFLNAACKLTGAVWLHHHRGSDPGGMWREPGLTGQLAAVGRLLGSATDQLRRRLAHRLLFAEPAEPGDEVLRTARLTSHGRTRIAVLASVGARSANRLVAAATGAGMPIAAVCRYAPAPAGPAVSSNYSSAWYPPASPDPAVPPAAVPDGTSATRAATWGEVATAIGAAEADLVLLLGMPIVPARVLAAARLGVLNAHNGALPSYRGMDAVAWALLHNQPIVCSLHLACPAVDAGEIAATLPVPVAPTRTLSSRVKTTQLRLLLAGAAHVSATGALPDLTPQPAGGTQYYRLHPHLKRLLDASPYAYDGHPSGR